MRGMGLGFRHLAGGIVNISDASPPLPPTPISISGNPGSAIAGQYFSFLPDVHNGSGIRTFSLVGNLPTGLVFDNTNGEIEGIPASAGTTSGLSISVTDNTGTDTLGPFSIIVSEAPAIQTLAWDTNELSWGADALAWG